MPMDVAPVVAPSPWATGVKDATSTATGGDGGWAKFETGQVAGVRNNESDSGWANFSPMNWTEQEDANTARYSLLMLVAATVFAVGRGVILISKCACPFLIIHRLSYCNACSPTPK